MSIFAVKVTNKTIKHKNKMEIIRTERKEDLLDQMRSMEVDDCLVCQPEETLKVQAYASKYGFIWGRKFRSRRDEERQVLILTRIK